VSLDDVVDDWIAGVPNGDRITLRQVLNHTAGIYSFTDRPDIMDVWGEPITPEDIVAAAAAEGPQFEPGTQWSYSNTGYIIIGIVIERASGSTYGAELRSRILDPQGLADTFLEGHEEIPGGFVPGWGYDDGWMDVTDSIDPSWAWAAGSMVSTVDDLVRWAQALFGGDVLGPDELAELVAPAILEDGTNTGYGMGIGVGLDEEGNDLYAHSGGIPAYNSLFLHVPATGVTAAALVNTWAGAQDVLDNTAAAFVDSL
jgi:D-alanyl-D-alanine carboxypeptidase